MTDIGNKIKNLRNSQGLTQQQLAKKMFVSNRTVSHWENNTRTPNPEALTKLAKLLNVTIDYFYIENKLKSNFEDLTIVTNQENRCAIFDKKNSVFLTPHIYSHIRISVSGFHICSISNPIDEQDIFLDKIDIVDRYGNVRHVDKNIIIGYLPFNAFGVTCCYMKEKGWCLINKDLQVLTPFYQDRIASNENYEDCGFFVLLNNITHGTRKLLNSKGEIIISNFASNPFNPSIFDVDVACQLIRENGIYLINYVDKEILATKDSVIKMLDLFDDYFENIINNFEVAQDYKKTWISKQKLKGFIYLADAIKLYGNIMLIDFIIFRLNNISYIPRIEKNLFIRELEKIKSKTIKNSDN